MITLSLATLAVLCAYLIGAIPFGYLVARSFRGIDIRTVGSGNIGATNVGRVLGFRFFLLVFAFDMAKGLLPTLGLPRFFTVLTGQPAPPDLRVLVALAAILGHNFPVYLRFKGGKGVATSLGAMLGLDPVAALSSAAGFGISLGITRYVSLSSIVGGVVFCIVHFARVAEPWSREERAMSVVTIGLAALLVARHRKNLGRILSGTEPKVGSKKRPPEESRSGRVRLAWLILIAAFVVSACYGLSAWSRIETGKTLTVGSTTLREVARVATGHQRAERVAFADGGRLLAVTCPRYNRLVLYRVTRSDALELLRDVEIEGKPVAVCPTADRLYVLERPAGDVRHVKPGWWEAFDFQGEPIGVKTAVGFYPDDMALSPDARLGFVLTSGRAEGDAKKPAPALDIYELVSGTKLGHVEFDAPADDPARLTLSNAGRHAAVVLHGSNEVAAIELSDPTRPALIGRTALDEVSRPYPSRTDNDWIVMPASTGAEGLLLHARGLGDCVASTLPNDSGLEFVRTSPERTILLGKLSLRTGAFGLSKTRPIGLAFCPERNLIAVANRSGSVHLVAIRNAEEAVALNTLGLTR